MSAGVADWFVHPVTLGLAAVALAVALLLEELAARALAEMGSVRFQGVLEDHERLAPRTLGGQLRLPRLLDALRWLEIGTVGLLWLVAGRLLARVPGGAWLAVAAPLLLVLASRLVARRLDEAVVVGVLRTLRPLVVPLVLLARATDRGGAVVPAEDEEEEASEREIQAFIKVGHDAGIIEEDEGRFLEQLVDFFDTTVREVMTPRTDMVAAPADATFDELLDVFVRSHKSRIPVYEGTVDRIVGVVHVKDAVGAAATGERPRARDLAKPCLVVPESKRLGELLRDFQTQRQQLAIVVDEYGGTSGLVTLEDALEEIVGEIEDEHDREEPPEWEDLGDGRYRIQGRAPVELLEELFGVEAEDEEVDTVGGLVFGRHGTVPEPGVVVEAPDLGLRFEVERMGERRVETVIVERLARAEAADGADG